MERQKGFGWFGNYGSWSGAKSMSTGYEDDKIIEKVLQSTLKVLNNEALFERDSVVFTKMEYNWPLLSILAKAGFENGGKLNVLDFGGALGSSFFQCRYFLGERFTYSWKIVEQSNYVKEAKENINLKELSFYETIQAACNNEKPYIILISSVLPYIENYKEILNQLLKIQAKHFIIDRTTFINDAERITLQVVPENIYEASYPCRFFNQDLKDIIEKNYDFVIDFQSYCDPRQFVFEDGKIGTWKGLYFTLK